LAKAGLPEELLLERNGTYWVPLETTLIGKPFQDAVAKGAEEYAEQRKSGKASILDLEQAWQRFEPATMPATDWSAAAPGAQASQSRFDAEVSALFQRRYDALKQAYDAALAKDPADADTLVDYGLLEHQAGRLSQAEARFQAALKAQPGNAAALNDLGSLAFEKGDFAAAEKSYLAATQADGADADLWANLVRAEVKLKKKSKAKEYGLKAVALDAGWQPALQSWIGGDL
jgi:tetratricopeptide (TPR) repeat protein